jgi:uncharacterized protein YjiS (DUF1127 family)
MMTRPIHYFDSLSSEATPAGGNAFKADVTHNERRVLEIRARYARAEMVGDVVSDAVLWLAHQAKRLVAPIREGAKLRAAETQLNRMSDRELSDLGLCRADIPFAVREQKAVEGVMPEIDNHYAAEIAAANRNNSALFWAGRA